MSVSWTAGCLLCLKWSLNHLKADRIKISEFWWSRNRKEEKETGQTNPRRKVEKVIAWAFLLETPRLLPGSYVKFPCTPLFQGTSPTTSQHLLMQDWQLCYCIGGGGEIQKYTAADWVFSCASCCCHCPSNLPVISHCHSTCIKVVS